MATSTSLRAGPIGDIVALGQSVWFDNIRRGLLTSGELERMVREDGLRGLTSNPSIFEKAIAGSTRLRRDAADARTAAPAARLPDAKRSTRSSRSTTSAGAPICSARSTSETRARRRLRQPRGLPELAARHRRDGRRGAAPVAGGRPAEPDDQGAGDEEGIPAIRALIAEGINVNITLLFSRQAYAGVVEAYLAGLEDAARRGRRASSPGRLGGELLRQPRSTPRSTGCSAEGRAALDSARQGRRSPTRSSPTRRLQELFAAPRWQALRAAGARRSGCCGHRPSTKNPAYPDVYYVEALIGPRHRRHDAAGDARRLPRSRRGRGRR